MKLLETGLLVFRKNNILACYNGHLALQVNVILAMEYLKSFI